MDRIHLFARKLIHDARLRMFIECSSRNDFIGMKIIEKISAFEENLTIRILQ